MDTKTSQFHYSKFDSILDGSVILPTRICPSCTTEVSEFWISECNQCHSTLGNAQMIFDPKNKDIQYLVLDDKDLIAKFQNEATWICTNNIGHTTNCLALNSEDADTCTNLSCQASRVEFGFNIPKTQSNNGVFQSPAQWTLPTVGKDKIVLSDGNIRLTEEPKTTGTNVTVSDKNKSPLYIVFGVFASLLVAWQSMFWFSPTVVTGTVIHSNWHTQINVEHLVTSQNSDWSTPIGAYNISSYQKVKSYDTVQSGSHQESQTKSRQVQNGTENYDCSTTSGATIVKNTCSRATYTSESYTESVDVPDYTDVPVYADYYTYDVDSWELYKSIPKDGQDNTPTYPVYTLATNERTSTSCSSNIEVLRDGVTEKVANNNCLTVLDYKPGLKVSYNHNRANNNWGPKIN